MTSQASLEMRSGCFQLSQLGTFLSPVGECWPKWDGYTLLPPSQPSPSLYRNVSPLGLSATLTVIFLSFTPPKTAFFRKHSDWPQRFSDDIFHSSKKSTFGIRISFLLCIEIEIMTGFLSELEKSPRESDISSPSKTRQSAQHQGSRGHGCLGIGSLSSSPSS